MFTVGMGDRLVSKPGEDLERLGVSDFRLLRILDTGLALLEADGGLMPNGQVGSPCNIEWRQRFIVGQEPVNVSRVMNDAGLVFRLRIVPTAR